MTFAGLYAPAARIGGGLERDQACSGMPYREISAPQGPQKLSQALISTSMQKLVSQGACPSPEHHAFDRTAPPQNRHFPSPQSSGRPACTKLTLISNLTLISKCMSCWGPCASGRVIGDSDCSSNDQEPPGMAVPWSYLRDGSLVLARSYSVTPYGTKTILACVELRWLISIVLALRKGKYDTYTEA